MRGVGAYSRPEAWANLDQRSSEARFLKRIRADLTEHVGPPSATKVALIERAAMLSLHIAKLDEKALAAGGSITEHDSKTYLSWSNSLVRTLAQLGLDSAPGRSDTYEDIVRRHDAAKAAAA